MNEADRIDPTWRERAACGGHPYLPPETWHNELPGETRGGYDQDGLRARDVRLDQAKRVCNEECPVQETCLRDAINQKATGVVRGGRPFGRGTASAPTVRAKAGLAPVPKRPRGGYGESRPAIPCGREGGVRRHLAAGEDVCDPCRLARNAAVAARKARRKLRDAAARAVA